MDPIRPDYAGASVTQVVGGLLERTAPAWMPEIIDGARSIVLLVLDGLGWSAIEEHRDELPMISSLPGRAITTVVPSTTGAALTSITTGLAPAQHGVVGYRMRIDGGILNVLRWKLSGQPSAPPPVDVQPHQAFGGRPVPVVSRQEFTNGGFTGAHMRGATIFGWRAASTLIEHCRVLVERREPFIYAYYDGVDQVAHTQGIQDRYFEAELGATDNLVTQLVHELPESAALVVTSDHGQVHFGPEGWRSLAGLAGLVEAYGGDGRFRALYAAPGAGEELAVAAREQFDDVAWVFTREQLCDEGWLGPAPPSRAVRRRIGDVVLAAREPVAFVDPTHQREVSMVAGHGSVTPDEMLVPLLAARGRAQG
ncbi:MAG: alkaline phosphatase family protein [Actinobacteria bacterium]|nr:alkaline phosphatase family protein [Actinomycetota bacterium]